MIGALNSNVIPNFVKAKTPQGVRRLFLRASAREHSYLKPMSINFVNGEWYIWFVAEVRDDDPLLTGNDKGVTK